MTIIKRLIVVSIIVTFLFPIGVRAETIEELIKKYSEIHKVNYTLAFKIAKCESNLNPNAKNPKSTATGVYQWLYGSFVYYGTKYWGSIEGKSRWNPEDNIELAMWVMSWRGTKDWVQCVV